MENTLQEIETEMKTAKERVEFGEAIKRLKQNKDFVKVVIDGYLNDNAVRLVHLKSDPTHQSAEQQLSISKEIDAIGSFNAFLNMKLTFADMSEKAVEDMKEMIEQIEQGDLDNE